MSLSRTNNHNHGNHQNKTSAGGFMFFRNRHKCRMGKQIIGLKRRLRMMMEFRAYGCVGRAVNSDVRLSITLPNWYTTQDDK